MKLELKRTNKYDDCTIGELYVDGEFFCYTCEDKDRGLNSSMSESEVAAIKVASETAIPTGTYYITLNVVSPKYSKVAYYKNLCDGGKVPRLVGVVGFDGVLIHKGNTAEDSAGCILVGTTKGTKTIYKSADAFSALYAKLKSATDSIVISIS